MKIIIPVAGIGARLRPHTHTIPKVLIKLAGKTIIEHILDELLKPDRQFNEIVFIVGHLGEKIKKFVNSRYKKRIKLSYVYQEKRRGIGHAVFLAEPYISDESVLIILGDTIFKADFNNIIRSKNNFIGVKDVDDPRRFGIAFIDKNNNITKFVEKPKQPGSNLALVGIYLVQNYKLLFSKLEYMIKNNIKTKGEFQITDALQLMLKAKEKFKAFEVDKWLDCGEPETLLETNKELLIEHNTSKKIRSAIINPPVYISDSALVKNSVIGPYVSIGDNVVIEDSIIQNSIINDNVEINRLLLNTSIIGSDAFVKGSFRHLNIGDSSEVTWG